MEEVRNMSAGGWWADDDQSSPMPLDGSEGGLWSGSFVPPPPRPVFLDESVTPDGLTTCDLCSWAWQGGSFTLDPTFEAPGELGWLFTLVIVSVISAVIGAVVMITALHCKSRKSTGPSDIQPNPSSRAGRPREMRSPLATPSAYSKTLSAYDQRDAANGVWSWLTSRRAQNCPSQLGPPPTLPAENHYTHMDETYAAVDEALYAELDRESNSSPAYQNSAYTDPEAIPSSAPSSAYYSDLSVATVPERPYEVIGLNSPWEGPAEGAGRRQAQGRLAAISENMSMPSDYV